MHKNEKSEMIEKAAIIDTGKSVPQDEQILIICQSIFEIFNNLIPTAKGE